MLRLTPPEMAHGCRNNIKYVYDLPYFERVELCRILDQNDKWEELGGKYMHFDVLTIQTLKREILRGNSPADELLTKWGHQNHTILELFVLLSKMQHYQAMLTIKQFVDPEYHRLIYEGEQNLDGLFQLRCPKNKLPGTEMKDQTPSLLPKLGIHDCQKSHIQINRECGNLSPLQQHKINGPDLKQSSHERNQERKILNNENVHQPRKTSVTKNSDATTYLGNREENAVANDASDLHRPKLKGETVKDRNMSEISSIAESIGILPFITFNELEEATNNWDQSAILGRGGFGTVYKGTWKNTQVAIKRTKNSDSDENRTAQIQQILGELKMLNSYRHDNILPLYGFSLGIEEPCLVYQFMPNGSLEDRLLCRHGTKPLTWFQKHNIATGTARGIQFLHTIGEKPLIHGDIKSANILLDSNYEPKIGDFGLAREGPYSHYTHMKVSKVHGTRPYLPDEFLRHKKFSTKVDTHSFGIVLFELGTGLRAYDDQRTHKFLKDLIEYSNEKELKFLIDKKCGPDEHSTFDNLIALGKCCTSRKPKDRPEMVMVLKQLNAMAVTRDTIVKVHNMMRYNSVSPINLFEMQVIHDHFSQQKKISPSSVPTMHRAVSPLGQMPPETNRAVSPGIRETPSPNNNYFSPSDPVRPECSQPKPRLPSPANNNPFEQDYPVLAHKLQNNVEARPTPVISISPPSDSQSKSIFSEDSTSEPQDSNHNADDFDYDYSTQFDNVLPLISELGIKTKPDKKEEDPENGNVSDVKTSARGKNLWILEETL